MAGDRGADVLFKWCESSWWKWDLGSALIFWRWPEGWQSQAAFEGFKPQIQGTLPKYFHKSSRPKTEVFKIHLEKLSDIIKKGYVRPAPAYLNSRQFVRSLFDVFDVEKPGGFRMVYNGSSCGLNDAVWAPGFWLPTAKTAARYLHFNLCFMDKDLGEIFLNFPVHEQLASYLGFDLTHYKHHLGFIDCTKRKKIICD